jgi:hypothetical protein
MFRPKVKHHLAQKFGVMRLHFERRNQVANLVILGIASQLFRKAPEAAQWQKYPLTAVNSCLAGPNICQVKPAAFGFEIASGIRPRGASVL